jgi:7-carboxy-7-deazaguanine synthase
VGCPWCDTKETWDIGDSSEQVENLADALSAGFGEVSARWCRMSSREIAEAVAAYPVGITWVMLTGGEPALTDLGELVKALHHVGKSVALETSGTAAGLTGAQCDWVCVSPKWRINGSKHLPIIPAVIEQADELKFPIGKREDVERVHLFLDQFPRQDSCEVSLQPLSMSKAATKLVIETCQQEGWRASIQAHKYIHLK